MEGATEPAVDKEPEQDLAQGPDPTPQQEPALVHPVCPNKNTLSRQSITVGRAEPGASTTVPSVPYLQQGVSTQAGIKTCRAGRKKPNETDGVK